MSGPNPDAFQRALKKFKASLDPNLQAQFSQTSLSDVYSTIRDIQDKQATAGEQRDIRRLQAFIEAMDQFGKVIEIFLNANEILCFVWGPIKFLLTASIEWKSIFKAAWKTFETELGPIITSLASRRALLESEKASASLYEINNIREKISSVYQEQQCQARINRDERHRTYMREIKVKLQSPEYQINQEISTESRGESQSGQWIFEHSKFEPWYDSSTLGSMVLYINGIPGAGKTTLMSTIIERLLKEKRSSGSGISVVYFYFKYSYTRVHNGFLRAILEQLISQNATLSGQLFDDISDIEGENLRKTERLQHLVKEALETSRISFLVLDGLDECPKDETEQTVKWLLSILEEQSAGSTLRIIFSGQRDGVLDRLLKPYPSIPLDVSATPAHTQDINRYCAEFCTRIQEEFDMSLELRHEILTKVMEGAQDMFLYARVVLHNLMNQATLSDLKKELQPGTFPKGIEDAYNRVVTRVLEGPVPRQKRTLQLLGLIVAAQRPLRWREIQGFFCIDSSVGEIDYENKRLRKSCKDLCGALVDVHQDMSESSVSEDLIRIVHPTAKSYIIQKNIINLSLEHAKLSRFCSEYLTSRPFKAGIGHEQIACYAASGYYGFLDYAVQNWYQHAGYFIEVSDELDVSINSSSFESLRALLIAFLAQVPDTEHLLESASTYTIELYKNLAKDDRERNSQIEMELRVTLIRQQIERLYRDGSMPIEATTSQLYGPRLTLKCHKSWCSYFTDGFKTTEEQQAHLARHERSFYCPQEGCFTSSLGFASESLLETHRTTWHPMQSDPAQFPTRSRKKYRNLRAAVISGDIDAVEFALVSQTLTSESNTKDFQKALLYTARQGDTAMCRLLMSHGAINPSSNLFLEALVAATVEGNLETVKLFGSQLGDGIGRDCGHRAFLEACEAGHLATAEFLYDTSGCHSDTKSTALSYCISNKDTGMLKYLLGNGFADSAGSSFMISHALECGWTDNSIFKLILDARRASFRDVSRAIEKGAIKLAEILLSHGVDFDDIGQIKLVYHAFAAGAKDLVALITNIKPVFNLPPLFLFEPWFDLENAYLHTPIRKLIGNSFLLSQEELYEVNQLAKKSEGFVLEKQKDFNRRRLHQELDDPTIAEFQSQGRDILECFYWHQAFQLLRPSLVYRLYIKLERMGREKAIAFLSDKT
ncbi:hypothetical protein KAF25_001113 [Fusarium avenaceum]|uniref:NACHT domain-containing protein n=1 Tax=Fusarium avenaceum TaxID=40199 RepID=A0A9P7HE91_9HYPO|nr:hypothetical protein KAF25_001113 [Fusarium avenaceum]